MITILRDGEEFTASDHESGIPIGFMTRVNDKDACTPLYEWAVHKISGEPYRTGEATSYAHGCWEMSQAAEEVLCQAETTVEAVTA